VEKIKKTDAFSIELENERYFKALGRKTQRALLVGFALETNNEENAAKLKNADLIVNFRTTKGPLGHDTIKSLILKKRNELVTNVTNNNGPDR
jgi:phosphopantothenoylcysteine synthetase/decarboxylase